MSLIVLILNWRERENALNNVSHFIEKDLSSIVE